MADVCKLMGGALAYQSIFSVDLTSGDATQTTGLSLGEDWADRIILRIIVSDPKSTGAGTGTLDLIKAADDTVLKTGAFTITSGKYSAGTLESLREIAAAASKAIKFEEKIRLVFKTGQAAAATGNVKILIEHVIASDTLLLAE